MILNNIGKLVGFAAKGVVKVATTVKEEVVSIPEGVVQGYKGADYKVEPKTSNPKG